MRRSLNVLPALLFALKAAYAAMLLTYTGMQGVSSIASFSSGALTLSGITDKARDYDAVTAFVVLGIAFFIATFEYLNWSRSRSDIAAFRSLNRSLLLANIPAVYGCCQILFVQSLPVPLVLFSLLAESVLLICSAIFALRRDQVFDFDNSIRRDIPSVALYDWILPFLLFSLVAGALTPASWTAFASLHGHASAGISELISISKAGKKLAVGIAVITCCSVFFFRNTLSIQKGGAALLGLSQIFLLLGAGRLLGPLLLVNGKLQYAVSLSFPAKLVLVILTVVSLGHVTFVLLRLTRLRNLSTSIDFGRLVTPLAAVMVALILKISVDAPLFDLTDEYHTGEFVLPYWSWKTFGLLPYVDLAPARGWVNLLYGWIAEEGIGPHYVSYAYTGVYASLLILLFLFVSIRWSLGTWPAFLLVCLAPAANGVSDIDIVNAGCLAIICRAAQLYKPTSWLVLWVILGTASVLFAPGQGALLVVATALLGLVKSYSAFRLESRLLARTLVGGLFLAGMLALFSPVGSMIFGAVRYGFEQSAANTEANGIAWSIGAGTAPVTNKALWEAYRHAWLFVTIGIGAAIYLPLRHAGRNCFTNPGFIIGIPIVIMGVLFIVRADGRIDPGSWSRTGIISTSFVSILLPLFMFFQRKRVTATVVLILVGLAGTINPFLGNLWNTDPFSNVPAVSSIIDGNTVGVDRLGSAIINGDRVQNYANLKRFVDSQIGDKETFVDLTNRSSLYYLLNRRPPIEVTVYNLTNPSQQLRAVKSLDANSPPLALASSNTILHDGGPLSLRAYFVYRYIIENYRPIKQEGALWLRRRQEPANTNPEAASLSPDQANILEGVFAPRNLGALPLAWKTSAKLLRGQTSQLLSINTSGATLHDLERTPDGDFRSIGGDPYFIVDTTSADLKGSEKGILSFDLHCSGAQKSPAIQMYWRNDLVKEFSESATTTFKAEDGSLIVPLDSFPTWTLGGRVTAIRFDLVDGSSCRTWHISDATLAQRSAITKR